MPNLQEWTFRQIKHNIIKPSKKSEDENLVLITDDSTLKIVSSCVMMQEINLLGIGAILNINYARDPLKTIPAIYFLTPIKKSVDLLISDFEKKPSYKRVHLFFSGTLSESLLTKIKGTKNLRKYIHSLYETNLNFLATESLVFNLDYKLSLPDQYNKSSEKKLTEIAKKLASFCVCIKEFPYIRYLNIDDNEINELFANKFEKALEGAVKNLDNWEYNKKRSTIIIIDRSFDKVAPLLHECTYQAMIYDLESVKDGSVTLGSKNKNKKFLLREDEELWTKYRHEHIASVTRSLAKTFSSFREKNKIGKGNKKDMSMEEMKKMIRNLPEYKKEMDELDKHMTIAADCMDKFKKKNLSRLCNLEQDIVTGLDESGDVVSTKDLEKRISEVIQDTNIDVKNKVRLVMVFTILMNGLEQKKNETLFNIAKFKDSDKKAFQNLECLGININRTSRRNSYEFDKRELKRNKEHAENAPFEYMRYLPKVYYLIKGIIDQTLSEDNFPFVKDPPKEKAKSRRRLKNKVISGRKSEDLDFNENDGAGLIILFILGGTTYSEMRSVYNWSKKEDLAIVIGSNSIINADSYIKSLID